MTAQQTEWQAFAVDADGAEDLLGQVVIEDGVVAIASLVDEDDEAYVREILDAVNAMDELVEKAPPAADADRYTVGVARFERGAPGFDQALVRKLEKGFALRLVPTA